MNNELRIIISGGGTGGHIFPAISIANAIKAKKPDARILFVGAEDRMEMQRVPTAGYEIKGLPVCGFDRHNPLKNIKVVCKLLKSQCMARRIIKEFKPQVAVGVGGYASGPTLNVAGRKGIPTLIQEQNSIAGVTNKLLAKRASKICVAYAGMDRFFDASKILLTGNPVRQGLTESNVTREEAAKAFGLNPARKIVLVIGGSLGARTLNESILTQISNIAASGVQFIWQTGKYYYKTYERKVHDKGAFPTVFITDFIANMDYAYKCADLIISRAGAGSISEFCLLGKPVILVPSPNVAEDHQTKNALALVNNDAAIYVKDKEAVESLVKTAIETVKDDDRLKQLSENITKMAFHDSANVIADEVIKLAEAYKEKHEH